MAKKTTSGSKLAPFFQKIEKLTKPQRIGIYATTLVLIVGLSVWLLFWPKHQRIDTLGKQLAQVQVQLAKAKKNAAEMDPDGIILSGGHAGSQSVRVFPARWRW